MCCVKLSCLFGALQYGTALLTLLLGLMTLAHLKSTRPVILQNVPQFGFVCHVLIIGFRLCSVGVTIREVGWGLHVVSGQVATGFWLVPSLRSLG